MMARSWNIGWRIAILVLMPFGLLALVVFGLVASIWSDSLKREYLLWRWRRSYRGKALRSLGSACATSAGADLPEALHEPQRTRQLTSAENPARHRLSPDPGQSF
jgi:hypothetical protein